MSIIVKDLACSQCGKLHMDWGSFGHPLEDMTYKWVCDQCGKENVYPITAWIDLESQEPQNNVVLYLFSHSNIRVLMGTQVLPLESFQWREFEEEESKELFDKYITLEDISNQMIERFGPEGVGVLYVWVESPLYGVIYQYGNYRDGKWWIHGKTKGYY